MARTKEQKIKLLLLYDLLRKQTDENHALTTGQIIELLRAKGVDVSRKVLPNDIALLNEFGYEVMTKKDTQTDLAQTEKELLVKISADMIDLYEKKR